MRLWPRRHGTSYDLLVAGLGNPGKRYADTRHNLGYKIVERVVERAGGSPDVWKKKFSGLFTEIEIERERVLALEPTTYMNESGGSVAAAASFYKISAKDVLVIHDELDLPFGVVRLKIGGGEAGHNGLKSVTERLGTRDYVRLRIGVGKPPAAFSGTGADYVLQAFAPAERARLGDIVDQGADAVALFVGRGLEHAMNVTNRRAS
jgi:PTH1 family peptidyl-tRNA hydrolase